MQEAASNAGSSPGMTSPFAAMAQSPHENEDGTLAAETAFEAEQGHLEEAQQPAPAAADANTAGLQSSSFGSDQYADATQQQAGNLQPNSEAGTSTVQDGSTSSERETDIQSASSSDSRQNYRRKGRPKCILM